VYFPNKILGQMSKNRDLLKEAIEDAKVVKETAIASAKAALEEHFTPQLKSMLSAKLAEMEADEMDEEKEEMMEYAEEQPNRDMDGDGDVDAKDVAAMKEAGFGKFNAGGEAGFSDMEEKALDELNLDELLAELEADMEESKEEDMYEAKKDEDKKDLKEAEGEEEVETEEEINIEDMTEEELKSFIEDVIKDMVEAGELEAGEGMEGEEGEEMESEEEISIDEILAEIELDERKKYGGNKGDVPAAKRGDKKDTAEEEGVEDYKKKLKEAEDKLEEAYATLATVKSDLNEVNLLNAKLLYTNKIFKAKNLTESQKVKVLNAFDKASTVKETKLVFETLSEGLKETSKSHVNESLKTSLASKTTGIMPTAKKSIVEVNDTFTRMQKIAGIIK
jgi:hypothetical protein